jgi:poly(3-hydroxybutyrate) depolymerase
MTTKEPTRRSFLARCATVLLLVSAIGGVTASTTTASQRPLGSRLVDAAPPRVETITYTTHNGSTARATVLLPAGYDGSSASPLPLVISPHGRGGCGERNAAYWGNLPTVGRFAVVNPDGRGRGTQRYSYGFPGQIDDLARMPSIVEAALPEVRIDRSRIYALGSSMGGQETLLLVARHPDLLAGAVAMDSVTDLALRYRQVQDLPTSARFLERWRTTQGDALQSAMRREVGGTPQSRPKAYDARSPLRQAVAIARSGVPLEIWWSRRDRIVMYQRSQSGALYAELQRLHPRASVTERVGSWAHSKEMRSTQLLPVALVHLGLLDTDAV